jgi:hypothetical protein
MDDLEYRDLVRAVILKEERLNSSLLIDLHDRIARDIFPNGVLPPLGEQSEAVSDSGRLRMLLDILKALEEMERQDPSYSWTRGLTLSSVRRHGEAAADFLVARARFLEMADSGRRITGDEEDWSISSTWHAARNLAQDGQILAAAVLASELDDTDRAEIIGLIDEILRSPDCDAQT